MILSKTYTFEAAHKLPDWPDVHGHSYEVEIAICAPEDQDYVLPLSEFDAVMQPVLAEIDHKMLNDLIPVPTMENIARWFKGRLAGSLNVHHILIRRPSLRVECLLSVKDQI